MPKLRSTVIHPAKEAHFLWTRRGLKANGFTLGVENEYVYQEEGWTVRLRLSGTLISAKYEYNPRA